MNFNLIKVLFITLALILYQSVIFIKGDDDSYNVAVHNVTALLTVTEHCNYVNNTECVLNSSGKRVIRDILKNSKRKKTPNSLNRNRKIISFEDSKNSISKLFPGLLPITKLGNGSNLKEIARNGILNRLKQNINLTLNKLGILYPSAPDFVENIFEKFIDNCFKKRSYKDIRGLLMDTRDFNLLNITVKYLNNGFIKYGEFKGRHKFIYKHPEMYDFSQVLRNLTFWNRFPQAPRYFRNRVNNFISKFPQCILALTKFERVCIQNREYGEYLYAPRDPLFLYDKDRRYVFSWKPGNIVDKAFFYPSFYEDNFYEFKNSYGEDLYVPGMKYDRNKRHVLAWRSGVKDPDKGIWEVGDDDNDWCYLKNDYFDEYLYLSDVSYDNDRRYAFTWTPGYFSGKERQWKIRGC